MGRVARPARPLRLAASLVGIAAFAGAGRAGDAAARGAGDAVVLHEPIAPNPAEDLAFHVALEGDLPAAIRAPHVRGGVVSAPDPLRPPSPSESAYGVGTTRDAFAPDTDTRSGMVGDYEDPFTPSTAPYKRLHAFDAVRSDYRLDVRDARLVPLAAIRGGDPPRAEEDAFYADLVVDVPPEGSVRLPGVGPGARVVRSRLGVGDRELPFRILRDGADNWFLQPATSLGMPRLGGAAASPTRARLVMELAIPRAAFGGAPGDVSWSELPFVAPLPDNVAADAAVVRAAIGVSRAMRPREAIAKLVAYFRGFADSTESPRHAGSMYLDLALAKRGVCRHRAFAFLITAQSLGIPTRLIANGTHAWVEIDDGALWRRIELGGAGRLPESAVNRLAQRERYELPTDAFPWPQGAERGDEMVSRAGARAGALAGARPDPPAAPAAPAASVGAIVASTPAGRDDVGNDHRPPSTITLAVTDAVVHRGLPLHVRGEVRAGGEPCAHVAVELWLRDPSSDESSDKKVPLGALATGDDGAFEGTVVAEGVPLGDYELSAETPGDMRCGRGKDPL